MTATEVAENHRVHGLTCIAGRVWSHDHSFFDFLSMYIDRRLVDGVSRWIVVRPASEDIWFGFGVGNPFIDPNLSSLPCEFSPSYTAFSSRPWVNATILARFPTFSENTRQSKSGYIDRIDAFTRAFDDGRLTRVNPMRDWKTKRPISPFPIVKAVAGTAGFKFLETMAIVRKLSPSFSDGVVTLLSPWV